MAAGLHLLRPAEGCLKVGTRVATERLVLRRRARIFLSIADVPGACGSPAAGPGSNSARRGVLKGGFSGTCGGPGAPPQSEIFLSVAGVPGECGSPAAGSESNNARRGVLNFWPSGTNGAPGPRFSSPGGWPVPEAGQGRCWARKGAQGGGPWLSEWLAAGSQWCP